MRHRLARLARQISDQLGAGWKFHCSEQAGGQCESVVFWNADGAKLQVKDDGHGASITVSDNSLVAVALDALEAAGMVGPPNDARRCRYCCALAGGPHVAGCAMSNGIGDRVMPYDCRPAELSS